MLKHTKKIFCLLIIATGFFWAQASEAAGWVAQKSGINKPLSAIDMYDGGTGFAVGDDGSVIWKTTNGGNTWSSVSSGAPAYTYLNDIDAVSSQVAYAVGTGGIILKTINGGTSWSQLTSGTTEELYSVSFKSDYGYAVGANGTILYTSNAGASWVKKTSGTTMPLVGVSMSAYTSAVVAWAIGKDGDGSIVLYDGPVGNDWVIKKEWTGVWLHDIFTPGVSYGTAYAAGATGVSKTIDQGANWSAVNGLSGNNVSAIKFYGSQQNGLAVAGNKIFRTSNYGNTWTTEYANLFSSNPIWQDIVIVGTANDAWLVGSASNSGVIARYDATAPTAPGNLTKTSADNDNTPTFTWGVANDDIGGMFGTGVAKYEYQLDSWPITNGGLSYTVTFSADNSADGLHTLKVRAVDAAGNTGPYSTLTYTIDATAPIVSAVSPATAVANQAQSFTASYSDSIGVTSCGLFVNDLPQGEMSITGTTSGTASKSHTFSSASSYTVKVNCTDGINSTWGMATTVVVSAAGGSDTTAPTVGSISPATATVNSAQSFNNSYFDNVGVTSCELYVNDITQGNMSLAGTTSGTATKSYTFSSAGSYAVKAKCSDGTNTTWGAATTVVVSAAGGSDTTAPTGSVTINAGAAYTNSNSAALTLSCSDNVACTRMIVAVDGAVDTESMESFSTSKTVSLSSGDGTKTVAVKFKDSATNTSAQYTDTIILDTTAQDTVIITKPSSNNLGLGDFYFGYTGSSITPVTFECRLDTGVFASCESPKSYSNLSVGDHTFQVRAIDAAGNIDATADSYTWAITSGPSDTTKPTVGAITPATAQATVSQSFTASYSDAVGVDSCDLYVDSSNQGPMNLSGTTAGTASRAYTFTSTASHTLQARCSDAEGNTGLGSLTTVSVSAAPVNQTDTSAPSVPSSVKKVSDDSDKTPTFTWNSANDNTGVTSYVIQIDNGSLVDIGGSLTYTAGTLSDGSHTMKVFAKDAAGNSSPVASFEFTVKTVITDTPVSCSLTINGAYKLSGSPAVYYITDECNKRAFNKSNVFFTYFNSWSDVQLTTKTKLDKIPLDTLGFMPWGPKYDPKYGALVKIVTDPKVYLLLGGEKYWIIAEEIFTGLKYSWNWVEDIDKKLLDKYITGSEITYTDHHPNYTLVKYATSNKVYRLEPDPADSDKQVKRHIKNEKVFNALNFRWDRIVTISKTEVYKDGEELDEGDV